MNILTFTFVILTVSCLTFSNAKTYMLCELCKELAQRHNFNRSFLSNWICMIQHESGKNTSALITKPNGKTHYGLFQISNNGWCTKGRKGGICNAKCEDLLSDNIGEAAACAKEVYAREGFRHWNGWMQNCRKPENLLNLSVLCGSEC